MLNVVSAIQKVFKRSYTINFTDNLLALILIFNSDFALSANILGVKWASPHNLLESVFAKVQK